MSCSKLVYHKKYNDLSNIARYFLCYTSYETDRVALELETIGILSIVWSLYLYQLVNSYFAHYFSLLFYFDNFFTSVKFLELIAESGFIAVGTVRENRTSGACKTMLSNKDMKKRERGSYDYRCNGEIFVCKWNDNSIVNIASNHFTHEPVRKAKRYVKGKGKM